MMTVLAQKTTGQNFCQLVHVATGPSAVFEVTSSLLGRKTTSHSIPREAVEEYESVQLP